MRREGGGIAVQIEPANSLKPQGEKKKIPLWQIPSNITGNNETHVQRAEKTTVGHPSVRSEAKGAFRCFLSKSNPLQCLKLIDPLHWPSDSIKDLSEPPFLPLLQDPPPPANKKPLPCPCVERVSKIAAFLPPFCEMYLKIAAAQTLILRQTTRRSSNCSHQRWVAVSAFSPLLLSLKHIAAGCDHVECRFFPHHPPSPAARADWTRSHCFNMLSSTRLYFPVLLHDSICSNDSRSPRSRLTAVRTSCWKLGVDNSLWMHSC